MLLHEVVPRRLVAVDRAVFVLFRERVAEFVDEEVRIRLHAVQILTRVVQAFFDVFRHGSLRYAG